MKNKTVIAAQADDCRAEEAIVYAGKREDWQDQRQDYLEDQRQDYLEDQRQDYLEDQRQDYLEDQED